MSSDGCGASSRASALLCVFMHAESPEFAGTATVLEVNPVESGVTNVLCNSHASRSIILGIMAAPPRGNCKFWIPGLGWVNLSNLWEFASKTEFKNAAHVLGREVKTLVKQLVMAFRKDRAASNSGEINRPPGSTTPQLRQARMATVEASTRASSVLRAFKRIGGDPEVLKPQYCERLRGDKSFDELAAEILSVYCIQTPATLIDYMKRRGTRGDAVQASAQPIEVLHRHKSRRQRYGVTIRPGVRVVVGGAVTSAIPRDRLLPLVGHKQGIRITSIHIKSHMRRSKPQD